MTKASKACDISDRVRKRVLDRDGNKCVICGGDEQYESDLERRVEVAHYKSRSSQNLGLGIPQNLVTLCKKCHRRYDNGDKRKEYGYLIRDYLKGWYPNWNEKDLMYDKYRWLYEDTETKD